MTDQPILVLGATGGQGSAVIAALLGRAGWVRALVRNPDSASARCLRNARVETVAGALDDPASLAAAMDGVGSVFALTTPFEGGVDAEVAQGHAIVAAARASRVPHLVFSSVASANQHTGVPHFESKATIEAELAASDVPYTILGPTYFYDNALGGADRIREGVLDLPLAPDRRLQQVARRDLGAFAAKMLLGPSPFAGTRIELASDGPTPLEMADAMSHATGRCVRHRQVPIDSIDNEDMRAMWRFLDGPGYRVDLADLHRQHPDISWSPFATWADAVLGSS